MSPGTRCRAGVGGRALRVGRRRFLGLATALLLAGCGGERLVDPAPAQPQPPAASGAQPAPPPPPEIQPMPAAPSPKVAERLATFGGGCFWCTEAVYLRLKGVLGVVSGYSGGSVENPTYKQVSTGTTGHAEVIQVRYDANQVRYEQLLEVFFKTHDPTTLNRQGYDEGTQYRSIILTHDDEQARIANDVKRRLDASGAYAAPIVTEIVPFRRFYPAEDYHQDYFARNPTQGYCRAVVGPKVEKFEKVFPDLLKPK